VAADSNFLDVKIMGREYRVACSPDEQPALLAAVDLVDGKMREIAQRTKNAVVCGLARAAFKDIDRCAEAVKPAKRRMRVPVTTATGRSASSTASRCSRGRCRP